MYLVAIGPAGPNSALFARRRAREVAFSVPARVLVPGPDSGYLWRCPGRCPERCQMDPTYFIILSLELWIQAARSRAMASTMTRS